MPRYSATYRHTLRDAIFILSIWLACFIYSISFSYLYGYLSHEPDPDSIGTSVSELAGPLHSLDRDPETLSTPLGIVFRKLSGPPRPNLVKIYFYEQGGKK